MRQLRLCAAARRATLIVALMPVFHGVLRAADDPLSGSAAPLLRVFLKDGGAIASYGEFVRVGDRVVFSMPITVDRDVPELQLVDLSSDRVDWERTERYTESVRASRYTSERADADYALLSNDVAQALNDVGLTDDPGERLAIVQKARRTLAEWPASHYGFKRDEVGDAVALLDETIAELSAKAGGNRFDLTFVSAAPPDPPPTEPLLPAPTLQELVEQTTAVARMTDQPAQRMSLLGVVVATIDRHLAELPGGWAAATRTSALALLQAEIVIDKAYQSLVDRMLGVARTRARAADVRGVQRLVDQVRARDEELGRARPDTVNALLAEVDHELDAARRLRLERDRYALRLPELQRYRTTVNPSLSRLKLLEPALEDIKALSGSSPDALGALIQWATSFEKNVARVTPPDELLEVHQLLLSAAQLVDSAAKIRREAALTGSIERAWNASSAAAGALMLSAKARTDLQSVFRLPQLPR